MNRNSKDGPIVQAWGAEGLKFCWSGKVSREPQGPLSAEKGEAVDDKIFKSVLHKFSKCFLPDKNIFLDKENHRNLFRAFKTVPSKVTLTLMKNLCVKMVGEV